MKFRRKSDEGVVNSIPKTEAPLESGPYDSAQVEGDDVTRVDLGALLIRPSERHELRLQVNESTNDVMSVLLVAEDGAIELQPFSAPRSGGLWDEVRPQIAADVTQRGGTCTEQEGRFGVELLCQVPAQRPDGTTGLQASRLVGVDGPRWMLRATFLGRPAVEPDNAQDWEEVLCDVVVHRGDQAMAPARALTIVLPPDARRSS